MRSDKKEILSACETMVLLMKSTGRYVHSRIIPNSDKKAYRTAMAACISILQQGFESMDMIKARVNGLRSESQYLFKPTRFNKRASEQQYYKMAIDQAMEIVVLLEARFIVGTSDAEPRGYAKEGWCLYKEDDSFN